MILRAILICLICVGPVFAVEPDEILDDPILEQRARDLSKEIRCLVCQNEPIDSSDAQIARDLRVLIRERLLQGDSDAEVLQFLVDRYGEFVLLKPRFSAGNFLLWAAAPVFFVFGLYLVTRLTRRQVVKPEKLSREEKKRLDDLLD